MKRTRITNYKTKWRLLESAYGSLCYYCKLNVATQIDHIIPYSYSCDHSIDNLILCCQSCNLKASDKIFPSLYDKEKFLRKYKTKKNLICSNCFVVYYSSLSYCNSFLCPLCFSLEYGNSLKKDWHRWLKLLDKAEIDYNVNKKLAYYLQGIKLNRNQKINFIKNIMFEDTDL